MTNSFSLITLNCFGLWLPNTRRRLLALAQELEQRSNQVVCLQEIQLHKYQKLLVKACASFSYALYEPYFHCPKGGLLTLSRIPITSKYFFSQISSVIGNGMGCMQEWNESNWDSWQKRYEFNQRIHSSLWWGISIYRYQDYLSDHNGIEIRITTD